MQQNKYKDYLREQIEKRLYESFQVANIPKSIYNKVIDSLDYSQLIPSFYRCIRNKMAEHTEKYDEKKVLTRKKARSILGRAYNIPRNKHICVLNEMERQELISFEDKQKIIVNQDQ